jgi:anthranilate/para-aminobenzoate synthase component I
MELHVVELDVLPNPAVLANKIAMRPGAVWLWSNAARPLAYLASDPIECVERLDPEPKLVQEPSSGRSLSYPRWIGLLPYEAFRGLERKHATRVPDSRAEPLNLRPCWWRYGAIAVVTDRVRVVGDSRELVENLAQRLSAKLPEAPIEQFQIRAHASDGSLHENRIRAALGHIEAGDVYQVNLARRFDFHVQGRALNWLEVLGYNAPSPYGFALQSNDMRIAGTSPELCLSLEANGKLLTRPIKGTRPRGLTAAKDAEIVQALASNRKEIAELSMVIDLERNDLNRVATLGSVSVLQAGQVESYGPVHHRVATLTAQLRSGVSRAALLEAFLPSGSVTGAPKVRAMELIASLESERRGLYTGAYGWLGHDGSLRLAMAIRTLVAGNQDVGHYFAGGGIVADSIPEQEVEETHWKSLQILNFLDKYDKHFEPYRTAETSQRDGGENWAFSD